MEEIFQKDNNGNILPLFKENIEEKNFKFFFSEIKDLSIGNCINLIENLKEVLKKSFELGQIILDYNNIYNNNEKGLIQLIMEKYIFEEIKNEEKNIFDDFFIFISNHFQIEKKIYDFIYEIIGKMFRNPIIIKGDYKIIFDKCLDLLNIFYEKKEINSDIYKDNYFYLNNNEIIVNNNNFFIDKFLSIEFYFFINQFIENSKSILSKIIFSNNDELLIQLLNNNNIEIIFNDEITINENKILIKENLWNNIDIKIRENENKKEILILINNQNFTFEINKEINSLKKMIFFSNFKGNISSIIFSEEKLEKKFFSKSYIKNLYKTELKEKSKINENNLINIIFKDEEKNEEIIKENNEIEENNNLIPLFLFFKKKESKNKIENILDFYKIEKTTFPYYFNYNNLYLKQNIFLLGGTQNIFPLFELMFELFNKEEKQLKNTFKKIINILTNILSFEKNIDDALNINFFQIFNIFIEKLEEYNNDLLIETLNLFEQIFKNKNKSDIIYTDLKPLLIKPKVIKILSTQEIGLFDFLLSLEKKKKNLFYFLLIL